MMPDSISPHPGQPGKFKAAPPRHIGPGHDPLVMQRYRAPDRKLEGVVGGGGLFKRSAPETGERGLCRASDSSSVA